ncbi:MAG: SOS response-associated peptidase [Cyclobacteriaceae bacterium]
MCVRYVLASIQEAIEQEFQAEFISVYKAGYNIIPGSTQSVISSEAPSHIIPMKWGLMPSWAKSSKVIYPNYLAFAADLTSHPLYRTSIRRRRCLVPANAFILWHMKESGKITKKPFLVYNHGQRIMSFAGLWDRWYEKPTNQIIDSYSIITTNACKRLSRFSQSMPVIIAPSLRRRFLDPAAPLREVMQMMRPWESDQFNLYEISEKINDQHLDNRDLLLPIGQRIYPEYTYQEKTFLKLEGMGSARENPNRKPIVINLK